MSDLQVSIGSINPDVLILAAFQPELLPLHSLWGHEMSGRIGRLRVVGRAVGIGLPAAAVGAAMRIAECRPKAVVLIGTCGAYAGSRLFVGDVVVAERVQLVDGQVATGGAQFPEPMGLSLDGHPPLVRSFAAAGGRIANVGTSMAITVDDALAGRVSEETGASVEHLEAHGVGTACAAYGVPFTAVLGVANAVGSRAREQWRLHHHEAAAASAKVLVDGLSIFERDACAGPA